MRYTIIHPPAHGNLNGNFVTTLRYKKILEKLGHEVKMSTVFTNDETDVLIALHAFKSYSVIKKFKLAHPLKKLILIITGTDIYSEMVGTFETQESLELADHIIVLQKDAINFIPCEFRDKIKVIHQSVTHPKMAKNLSSENFNISLIGNLRKIKDPFRLAEAVASLPETSKIRVNHIGGALGPEFEKQALELMKNNERYTWHKEVSYEKCLQVLNDSHLMVLSSISEGGANVISEAISLGVPIICSEISCTIGLLGSDYPGLFEVGNTKELKALILKCETDPAFLQTLVRRGENLKEKFTEEVELQAWQDLLK